MILWFTFQAAHWHRYFENVPLSSVEFYASLANGITAHQLPDVRLANVDYFEGGLLSAKRIYLRIARDWLTYHVCAAPFGTGCFISARLTISPWRHWWVLFVAAGVIGFISIMIFAGFTSITNNGGIGLWMALVSCCPLTLAFLSVVAVWIFMCLHITFYRLDTMHAFHDAVHGLLIQNVNKLIEPLGKKPLTEEQSKPILHRLFRR